MGNRTQNLDNRLHPLGTDHHAPCMGLHPHYNQTLQAYSQQNHYSIAVIMVSL